jgi:CheY-like chemotaxis protein
VAAQVRHTLHLTPGRAIPAVPHQSHVLLVDDEPALREIMADALVAEGYRVTTAGNGAEALDRLAHDRPDLIVLDLMMPVLDGWAFIESYRESAHAEVPIVCVSAVMSNPMAERLRQLGVRVCLTKPFDLAEFPECVARVQRRHQAGSITFDLLDDQERAVPEVASFLCHLRASGCSPNTLSAYAHDLPRFYEFLAVSRLSLDGFGPPRSLMLLEYLRQVPSRRPAQRLDLVLTTSTDGYPATRLAPATMQCQPECVREERDRSG